MEEIKRKDQLLLKIVSENNKLKTLLRNPRVTDKELWGEPIKRLVKLGSEVLDYSNFLTEEELSDFCTLYDSAETIVNSKGAFKQTRAFCIEIFSKLVASQEDVLHQVIIPTLPKDKTIEAIESIKEEMADIKYNLDFLELSFLFIDKEIDKVVAAQKGLKEEERKELKIRVTKDFRKLRQLYEYVRDYNDDLAEYIKGKLNEFISSKDITDIKAKLKEIEKMIKYISSSFKIKDPNRLQNNNKELEEMLTHKR